MIVAQYVRCTSCDGAGDIDDDILCLACDGTGEMPVCGRWLVGDFVCDLPLDHIEPCSYESVPFEDADE